MLILYQKLFYPDYLLAFETWNYKVEKYAPQLILQSIKGVSLC